MSSDALPGADARHATGISSLVLSEVLDAVGPDPDLSPSERETSLRFADDEASVHVYTESESLIRNLLLHAEFTATELRVSDGDRFGARLAPNEFDGGRVTGVKGNIPIGCLTLKASPRTSNAAWKVVSSAVRDNDPRDEDDGEGDDE